MANYVETITTPGSPRISSLNGRVVFDGGFGRMGTIDTTGNMVFKADDSGIDTYDSAGNNMLHSGYDPSGTDGITAIARQGEDAISNV